MGHSLEVGTRGRPRRPRVPAPVAVRLPALPVVVLALLGLTAAAAGSSAPPQPLHVQTSSLVQDGQDLVWRVQLAEPFSPGALARSQQSLCLVIEHVSGAGQVCVAGPADVKVRIPEAAL